MSTTSWRDSVFWQLMAWKQTRRCLRTPTASKGSGGSCTTLPETHGHQRSPSICKSSPPGLLLPLAPPSLRPSAHSLSCSGTQRCSCTSRRLSSTASAADRKHWVHLLLGFGIACPGSCRTSVHAPSSSSSKVLDGCGFLLLNSANFVVG